MFGAAENDAIRTARGQRLDALVEQHPDTDIASVLYALWMLGVVDMAHSALAVAGVIIEAETLPDELVRKACRIAERAGVDQVVTSTGVATARHAVALTGTLRDSVGPRVQVKAAGRFKEAEEIAAAFAAGATHVATFLTSELIGGAAAIVTGGHLEPLAVGATVSRR